MLAGCGTFFSLAFLLTRANNDVKKAQSGQSITDSVVESDKETWRGRERERGKPDIPVHYYYIDYRRRNLLIYIGPAHAHAIMAWMKTQFQLPDVRNAVGLLLDNGT